MSEPTEAEVRARYARAIHTEHDRTWQSGADEFSDWLARVKRDTAAEALEQFATRCDGVPAVRRELQRQAAEYRKETT